MMKPYRTLWSIVFVVVFAGGSLVWGPFLGAADVDLTPGLHRNLPASGPLVTTSYHVFLPAIHSERASERLPMVLFASPRGGPDLAPFQAWAEEQGVILVSLVPPAAAFPQVLKPQVEAVLATVMATYHVDPALRFSFDSQSFVNRQLATTPGLEWAGFVGCGFLITEKPMQSKACIGWVSGPLDTVQIEHPSITQYEIETMRGWGNPVRVFPAPVSTEHWSPAPEAQQLLDWMLVWQRLLRSAPADKSQTLTWMRGRLTALQADPDHRHRLAQAETFLLVPHLSTFPEAKILSGIWAEESIRSIQAEPDAMQRNQRWEGLRQHGWARFLSSAQRRTVTTEIDTLRKNPDIRADSDSRAAYLGIEQRLEDLDRGRIKGDEQKALRGLIGELETISTRWPGTAAATLAKKRIQLREKELR